MALIQQSAPERPQCFADDAIWHSWLASAHQSGLRVLRRVDTRPQAQYRNPADLGKGGKTRYEFLPVKQIPYCNGCLWQHQRRMDLHGKCHPCEVQPESADAAV